jgi:RNA polymerase primary sigma factor
MNQELLFAKTLEEIKELALEQNRVLSKEQVEEAFGKIGMKPEELTPIYEYLNQKKIGIGEPVNPDEYLTEEDVDFLSDYVEQITLLPVFSQGEKEAYFLSAMAGDLTGKAKTIEILLGDIVDVAKLYTGQGVLLEDLIGEGNVALTMGVEMLGCLEKPEEVPGMLVKMAMDAMEALIQETEEESKIDRKIVDKVNEVSAEAKKLAESLNRKITVEELMEETSFSEKKIREAIRISGNRIEYFEGANEQ